MKPSPPTIAPAAPGDAVGAEDRELRRRRPGQQAAGGVGVLERARRRSTAGRSTTSSRSSAMCAGGPPNPVSPIRVHSRATVPSGTVAGATFGGATFAGWAGSLGAGSMPVDSGTRAASQTDPLAFGPAVAYKWHMAIAAVRSDGLPVLWQLQLSHYNEKVRWALDYKRIRHVRRSLVPGLHLIVAKRLTGTVDTTPVLTLDGRSIGDSTAIIAALEERWPQPPLYPADPLQRARALELEDFFDEQLGPHIRRAVYFVLLEEPDAVLPLFLDGQPLPGPDHAPRRVPGPDGGDATPNADRGRAGGREP